MGLTKQYKIAQKIGISEGQLSRIISGSRTPTPNIADSLSKLTSTDIRVWLFNTKKNISSRKKKIKAVLNNQTQDINTKKYKRGLNAAD